jgi:PhnB protein
MSAKVKPIPDGYRSVSPYLFIRGAAQAIDFYKQAFDASERMRMPGPNGKIMHAELQIGDSMVMLADEFPEMSALSPETVGGTPVMIAIYVDDVDATFNRAIAAGAKPLRPVANQFYGDRSGSLVDPFGHKWNLATHVEDVSHEEMTRRTEAMMKSAQKA